MEVDEFVLCGIPPVAACTKHTLHGISAWNQSVEVLLLVQKTMEVELLNLRAGRIEWY